jgi:P27 family predicted phage terminase small subunit
MKPPRHLSADVRRAWAQLVKQLDEAGILARVETLDFDALEVVATLGVRRRFFAETIEQAMADGTAYYATGTNGAIAPHPAFSQEKQAADTLYKYLAKLGLSPKDRAMLLAIEPDDSDELEL